MSGEPRSPLSSPTPVEPRPAAPPARPRWRRRYAPGRCQDCGQHRAVTVVRFWVNFMRYVLCAECIRAYRDRLLTHTPQERP